jgi:hypothetical protein
MKNHEKLEQSKDSSVVTYCTKCGHSGRLYLEGDKLDAFKRDMTRQWIKHYGLRVFWHVFTLGAVLGVAFGWWRP